MTNRPISNLAPPKWTRGVALIFCACMLLVACGGRTPSTDMATGAESSEESAEGNGVPTMPAARFAQPTTIIELDDSDAVTETSVTGDTGAVTETASAEGTPDAPGVDLERGARVYANNGCGECHGDAGEGVSGEGIALAGSELTEAEFEDVLRTGGGLGSDHLYGPSALSPSGLSAMYAWLGSLSGSD